MQPQPAARHTAPVADDNLPTVAPPTAALLPAKRDGFEVASGLTAAEEAELSELLQALPPRHRRYAEARGSGAGLSQASRAAGYASPQAARTAAISPEVARVSALIGRGIARRIVITKADVVQGMLDAVHIAADAQELVGAWREIGRLIGAYEPERIEVSVRTVEQLRRADDRTLQHLATRGTGELIEDVDYTEIALAVERLPAPGDA